MTTLNNRKYTTIASDELIGTTVKALKGNGFEVRVSQNTAEAKAAVLSLIPLGSEVFTNTSITLDQAGIAEDLNRPEYVSARKKMMALYGDPKNKKEMKQVAGTPEYAIGSAHAITMDGQIMVASATGSQIASEAYGADKVIFVVGAQKLVKDLAAGVKRIQEHSVPLEDERAQAAYGGHTAFNKLLVINGDMPGRITVVIVKENIGF